MHEGACKQEVQFPGTAKTFGLLPVYRMEEGFWPDFAIYINHEYTRVHKSFTSLTHEVIFYQQMSEGP